MAELTVQAPTRAGTAFTWGAAAELGDEFLNTGKEGLLVSNTSGIPIIVTIVTQALLDELSVTDRTVTVAQGTAKFIGPFTRSVYNDEDGMVQLTYDNHEGVEIAVVKVA